MEVKGGGTAKKPSGSKYLYEPFPSSGDRASLHRVETNAAVQDERWKALDYRLGQIETKLDRVDRRLWLTIFGVAAAVLRETVLGVLVP